MNSQMRFLCFTTKKDEDEVDWLGEHSLADVVRDIWRVLGGEKRVWK
jgi:hypothetical protein